MVKARSFASKEAGQPIALNPFDMMGSFVFAPNHRICRWLWASRQSMQASLHIWHVWHRASFDIEKCIIVLVS